MTAGRRWLAVALLLLAGALPAAAQSGETIEYYGLDVVGSIRVVFDANGAIIGRMDYGPFGEELSGGTQLPDRRFAGLFRDGEAGLDSAGARSYQVRTGRFSTVDPVYAGLFEPQRWNRYAYAGNNPLQWIDPSGLMFVNPNDLWCREYPQSCRVEGGGGREDNADRTEPGELGGTGSPDGGGGFETANGVTQTPTTDSTSNPNNACDPQTLAGCAPPVPPWWKEIGPRYRNAWNVGYYSCLAKSLTGSATAPVVTHTLHEGASAIVEHTSVPERAAGAYYRVIKGDKRFTAWGASSKVLVPRAAAVIRTAAGALNVAGWAYFDYELFHTVSECVGLLK